MEPPLELELDEPEPEPLDFEAVESAEDEPSPEAFGFVSESDPMSDLERAFEPALERSFLAQPEPLKCTVGGAKALRKVPSAPQAGQNRGPGSLIPWITSVRSPQFEQR